MFFLFKFYVFFFNKSFIKILTILSLLTKIFHFYTSMYWQRNVCVCNCLCTLDDNDHINKTSNMVLQSFGNKSCLMLLHTFGNFERSNEKKKLFIYWTEIIKKKFPLGKNFTKQIIYLNLFVYVSIQKLQLTLTHQGDIEVKLLQTYFLYITYIIFFFLSKKIYLLYVFTTISRFELN